MSSWAPHFHAQLPPLLLGGLVTVFQPDSFGQADSFPTPSSYLLSVSLLICMISLGNCIRKHGFSGVPQTNNCFQVRPLCPPSDCSSQCFLGVASLQAPQTVSPTGNSPIPCWSAAPLPSLLEWQLQPPNAVHPLETLALPSVLWVYSLTP